MKADDYSMSKVFLGGGDVQYVLPIFQREYAWEREEWETLLHDVVDTLKASRRSPQEHFMGSLVVIEEDSKKSLFPAYTLVDGQQRLTTISLLLCALRDSFDESDSSRNKLQRYLFNVDEEGDLRFKVLPTPKYDDRKAYIAIVTGKPADGLRSRISEAYAYFQSQIREILHKPGIQAQDLFECVLSSLYIVFIELDRTDKPYKIFESLNAKGKSLTEADLVRNYIAMRLPPEQQLEVFDRSWSRIEELLSERRTTARIPELTAFLRHYLALHSGELPNRDTVYRGFRNRVEKVMVADDEDFITEIESLHRFAAYYDKLLRPQRETHPSIKARLERLAVLQATTAYPLLMALYDLYSREFLQAEDFADMLSAIENYLVRRFLAGESTNYLNNMFASLAREANAENVSDASMLKIKLSERNYPSDRRVSSRIMSQRIYSVQKAPSLAFVLETLNRHLYAGQGGFAVLDGGPTIEHIMPRRLTAAWRSQLGHGWEEAHGEFLNTIGNLTIVTQDWNSSLSNSDFENKREKLANHALKLNSEYFNRDHQGWNVSDIQDRAKWLTGLIFEVWPALGDAPRSEGLKFSYARSLTVKDRVFAVDSWRGLLIQMVNCLHEMQLLTDLDRAHREFDWWIASDPGDSAIYYKRSSKGWWIYVNIGAERIVGFCSRLATYCGLSDDEWSFTYD